MTVASILKSKGSEVVSVQPGTRVRDAARILSEKRIGAALVFGPGRRILGILSERDVVKAVAELGSAALDAPVNDFMSTSVQACRPSDSIARVMELMTNGRFRHLPVMEGGELRGIISIGDVVKRRIDDAEHEADALRRYIAS